MAELIADPRKADTTDDRPVAQSVVATTMSRPGTRLLGPLVFFGGLTSIGTELAMSRLVAPYFGSSTFIWANLIGLTLTYLSIGYYVGGRVADRYPRPWLLYVVTAGAAFGAGLIPFIARPILDMSLSAFDRLAVGAFYGSLVGVIFLLAIPITLLGFVTPFAIRLRLADIDRAGNTAGRIYALSTMGSIAGSFLPVIVLIPAIGTTKTFLTLSLALLSISVAGLIDTKSFRWAGLAGLLALPLVLIGVAEADARIKPPYRGELVEEAESEYNYIQVLKDGDRYLLALNEGHAIHSIYDPSRLLTGGPWDYFMVAPLFNAQADGGSVKDALFIGLAGGTAARQLAAAYDGVEIDGVEIDPEVARLGKKYFALDRPDVNVVIDDGRYFLRRTDAQYDLIGIDAYRQPYIPFQLTTKEFFQEVADRLRPGGVAVVNVGRADTDYRLVDVIASTMRAVYPSVYEIDVDGYDNTMVIGTTEPSALDNFRRNTEGLQTDTVLRTVADWSLATGNPREVPVGGRVFTDDLAPVEWVVDQMIVDAARKGEDP
jgi:predicted membrane-bound spermidine synthase